MDGRQRGRELAEGLQQTGEIVGWLVLGATLGVVLAYWQAPGSQAALLAGALLFPATVFLGWMLLFPLAMLALPFMLPRLLRWLREPLPDTPPPRTAPRKASAAGWVFVAAALPTSLLAGLIAGAPLTYLLAGLLYGYAMRHSATLQDPSLP